MGEMSTYCGLCGWVTPGRHLCAVVAERDRLRGEVDRLKWSLFECARRAGADLDGDSSPNAIVNIGAWAVDAVTCLRDEYDEALAEAELLVPVIPRATDERGSGG